MAASGAGAAARQPRRGPAPIASFDHDVSDESSPESKQTFRLPEIREDAARGSGEYSGGGDSLAPPEQRARSHSTPAATALAAPPAPRIDISRASSSSHHDSRDSSPELALFAGAGDGTRLELGFREDGALDLRSSTEELAFLEPAPGESAPPVSAPPPVPPPAPPAPPAPPPERRHSRKDSQCSEAALLAVSGRTSRLSSVGSQCSAQSALSRISRLSVVSGTSRSPSPHRMLLETSFCGPKPIETDPEISAGALVEQILGIVKMANDDVVPTAPLTPAASPPSAPSVSIAPHYALIDARDRREIRTEVTVESARQTVTTQTITVVVPPPVNPSEEPSPIPVEVEKEDKETKNRNRTDERKARPRVRREPSEPEVYKTRNKSKDIIIIKLRPDDSYEEEEDERGLGNEAARKPATLELGHAARPADPAPPSPALSRHRSPSPAGGPPVSRKSSFCSLFKSRETIASPESPSEALRRKRSLTEGRSRSKSRDRSATPTSSSKIRGSVLSLFRTPRRSGASPSPGSREGSPVVQPARSLVTTAAPVDRRRADKLKYYEDTKDGIIHIPLRTPPDERLAPSTRRSSGGEPAPSAPPRDPRPASAPQPRALPELPATHGDPHLPPEQEPLPHVQEDLRLQSEIHLRSRLESRSRTPTKPIQRTVLPDGSIIIPLHSPTERAPKTDFPETLRGEEPVQVAQHIEDPKTIPSEKDISIAVATPTPTSARGWEGPTDTGLQIEISDVKFPATPDTFQRGEPPAQTEETRRKRKERLVFTTHVGSREQVFSTQFSITKTPSVTSEISGSFSSFAEGEEVRAPPLRDTHIAAEPSAAGETARTDLNDIGGGGSDAITPQDPLKDSSESEPSSEAAPSRTGNDVEKRGLVVEGSFEEELPFVPTTLPQERSVALPMVPVRERGGVHVASVQRPRAAVPPPRPAPPAGPASPAASSPHAASADKLRIKLPRRPRPASAATTSASRNDRPRTRSGGDSGGESRSKAEWIDFEEVPERRKQPKRIQTLPAGAVSDASAVGAASAGGVVFSYVEPEHCRCECHGHTRADDQLPLLRDDMQTSRISTSSAEVCDESPVSQLELSVRIARPFTADLDVRAENHVHTESAEPMAAASAATRP